jgi:4-hydroxy-2-oxoheptanedioate aldolase
VIETSLKMGVAPRAEVDTPEQARKYLEMGVKHFCVGTDVSILYNWFRDSGGGFNELLGRDSPGESGEHGGYGGAGD